MLHLTDEVFLKVGRKNSWREAGVSCRAQDQISDAPWGAGVPGLCRGCSIPIPAEMLWQPLGSGLRTVISGFGGLLVNVSYFCPARILKAALK